MNIPSAAGAGLKKRPPARQNAAFFARFRYIPRLHYNLYINSGALLPACPSKWRALVYHALMPESPAYSAESLPCSAKCALILFKALYSALELQIVLHFTLLFARTPVIGLSLLKKSILPAYAGFEITFLPRASRGKKHFYPHKCAVWRQAVKPCAQCGCPVGKPPYGGFSTVCARYRAFFLSAKFSAQQSRPCSDKLRERATARYIIPLIY